MEFKPEQGHGITPPIPACPVGQLPVPPHSQEWPLPVTGDGVVLTPSARSRLHALPRVTQPHALLGEAEQERVAAMATALPLCGGRDTRVTPRGARLCPLHRRRS